VKIVSDDHTFIYYFYDRFDGQSEGIRVGRSTGVVGFISQTRANQQSHPIGFLKCDKNSIQVPARRSDFPPILCSVLPEVQREHPEVNGILDGTISFEGALNPSPMS
jgi:hypothetical protein